MRYSNIKLLPVFLLFLLAFNSCKKSVAGPQGDKGENAPKGNLKQVDRSFTVNSASWTFNGGWYAADVYFPEITSDVVTKGEVKVYMKVGTQWWTLPNNVGDIFMEQSTDVGHLYLKYSKIHGGPPPAPGDRTFRVVCSTPA